MKRISEVIKNLIMIFLGVAMLALWVGYIYLNFDFTDSGAAVLDRDYWVFNDSDSIPSDITPDSSLFQPVAVDLILSGNGYTSAYNTQLTKTLYEDCSALVKEVLSSSYTCSPSDISEWNNALTISDAILIEYPSQLPYTVIAQFLQKSSDYCKGELCYVEKLLLFSEEANTPCALSVDSQGNVNLFKWDRAGESPSMIYDFNSNNLAAYTVNEGFIPFEFNISENSKKAFPSLPSEYKLLETAPCLPSVIATNPLQSVLDAVFLDGNMTYLELVDETALADILDSFETNPHVAGYYSDPHSGLVFVDENARLVISTAGTVTYSLIDTANPIITVSDIIDTAGTEFSSDKLLSAATEFIGKLQKEMPVSEALPILNSMSYSSQKEEFTFSFGYRYRGAQILFDGSADSIVLTFNRKGLVNATIRPMSITVSDSEPLSSTQLMTTDIVPGIVALLTAGKTGDLVPVYSVEEYGQSVTPFWVTGGQNK